MTDIEPSMSREEIAIVGMACRFPEAKDIDQFWRNVCAGIASIRPLTVEQLKASGVDEAALQNPSYVRAGTFLEDADCFDAAFFGFSPLEAEIMDPQHRILLECAWDALENAGYNPDTFNIPIGVFVGASPNTYFQNILMSAPEVLKRIGPQLTRLSNEREHAATRLSFKLNLKGPSISVSTACSSSGVGLHLACQSLLSGECDMALVGGARIEVPLNAGYLYEEGGILSPDGDVRAFDAGARGTVFGNGVGIIVVKRLSDAVRDGDTIYALIKGTAINNDGSLKVGYAAPSIQGQASVIEEALAMAEVDPDTIRYVETHGTGTALGDPIEVAALAQAFRKWTNRKGYCPIGSVKTNIGHLFAAAGVAGVIKTVLALKYKHIPPSLNCAKPNPQIDFESSPFYVNTRLSEWQADGIPRRAGVSSFGIGGTNAHIILEEAPEIEPSGPSRSQQLILVSAKTDTALETATRNLVKHLKEQPDLNPADVAYTLQVGRKAFNYRRMAVCHDIGDAVTALTTLGPERVLTLFQEPMERNIVFMFPGQGSQYANMGLELYRTESEFRKHIDRCCEILMPHLSFDLREILYPDEGNFEQATRKLEQTVLTQPALFVIEYALAKLWISWGVHPQALVGHSIGEYVAACLAGVFSLEDALALVATRGRLMQELPPGSMLAVPLSEKEIQPFLGKEVSVAGINGPSFCVVSGGKEAVKDLERKLSKKNVDCRHLHTSHAFHSNMMDPILDPFTEQARQVRFDPPGISIVSTVTGAWIGADEMMNPGYWARNLRQTVRFSECVQELLKEPNRVFLEVGPGQTLTTLVRQHANRSSEHVLVSSIRHPNERRSDIGFILNTLGRLWIVGIQVDWSGFYRDEKRHRVPLPTFPFERQRYWVEPRKPVQTTSAAETLSEEKRDLDEWFYVPSWKRVQLTNPPGSKALSGQKLHWLVFLDESGFGAKMVGKLQQKGQRVTTVQAGSQFSHLSGETYTVNPQAQGDYHSLLKELRAAEAAPNAVVHLWSLTSAGESFAGRDFLEVSQDLGFKSLLFLAQAIDRHFPHRQVQIKVISNHLHEVTGEEVLCPEKATLLGPCRVVSQEYSNIRCTNVDIVIPEPDTRQETELQESLLQELAAETLEPTVAYRGRYRWVQSFEAARLEPVAHLESRTRERGVYLITGGLGGIGLVLAEYLARTVRAKLALISRTRLPARGEWNQWLETHDGQDIICRRIRKVHSIEEMGAEVLTLSADVTDEIQMKGAVAQIHHRFGEIHGVIHAAGIAGEGIIQLKSPEAAEHVLAPKVKGTLVLAKLLDEDQLDFFVLCSSVNSLLGGIGQVDYCAANAFLDAYAHQHHLRKGTISINWCAWQEVGMAVNTMVPDDLKGERERSLKLGILPEEGREAFSRILGGSFPQVVVSTQDFLALMEQGRRTASGLAAKTVKASVPKPAYARPNLSSVYVVPGNPTEQTIAEIWQQVLGIRKVGIHDNFFDLGGHSLLVAQVIAGLRDAFPIEFPMEILFERPTVHLLGKMIVDEQEGGPAFAESESRGKKRRMRKLQRMKPVSPALPSKRDSWSSQR